MSIKDTRNYGIDLLRLVTMLFVVILHTISWGGMLNASETSAQANFIWLLDMWAFPAVSIFGMISGYVAYSDQEKKRKISSYIMIWLQVVFYGVAVTLAFQLLRPEVVDLKDLIRACFPVSNDLYWYFTAYTGLFFLMPLLDAGLRTLSKAQAKALFVWIFLLFSVYDSVFNRFGMNGGWSMGWLVLTYVLGGILKKCALGEKLPGWAAALGIVVCMVLPWICIVGGYTVSVGPVLLQTSFFESNTMPLHLLSAVLYILLFSRMRLGPVGKKIIAFAAPGAFAVYLLNCQPTIWWHVILDGFTGLGNQPLPVIFCGTLGFAIIFVAVSVTIDALRRKLFDLLHVRQILQKLIHGCEKQLVRE